MEARSARGVEVVEHVCEEPGSFVLVAVGGVVSLADEDGCELGAGFEEAAAFTDRFVDAVESGWAVAVAVAEESTVVCGESGHDRADRACLWRCAGQGAAVGSERSGWAELVNSRD